MSFWSGEKLLERIKKEQLIYPFCESFVDCAACTLHLGASAYTTGDSEQRREALWQNRTPGVWSLKEKETVTIQPGQFGFLNTQETIKVPNNAIGFISVKASYKFSGLINVSGFHVDPGWEGPLIFAVYNAGPRELVFERGQPLFLLFYSDLDRSSKEIKKKAVTYNVIPGSFIQKMAGDIPSLNKLHQKTSTLENEILDSRRASNLSRIIAGISLTITLALAGKMLFESDHPPQAYSAPPDHLSADKSQL
jgi:dCTP deaminase|tara:strand:+ start:3500 stop:4252 length:753 start_codon:yes stop_codon:yes gene_type:complete